MNTNSLAKQYDKLTARERFSLLLAALVRGDELDRSRLMQSAPRHRYLLADHHALMVSFTWLSDFHFTCLLDLAACYFEAFGALRPKRKKVDEAAWDTVMLQGYMFQTNLVGWRKFCAELNLEPEYLWEGRPGLKRIKRADVVSGTGPGQGIPGAAFVEEGVARWVIQYRLGDREAEVDDDAVKEVRIVNADSIAAELHILLEKLMEQWG
jgi:hypothetical protein